MASSSSPSSSSPSPPVQADLVRGGWESAPAPASAMCVPRYHPTPSLPYPTAPRAPRPPVVAAPVPEGGYALNSVNHWSRFRMTTTASLQGSSSSSSAAAPTTPSTATLEGSSSSSSSAAAPTTPSTAALEGSSSSSAAAPTTPSPSLNVSSPAALEGSSSSSSAAAPTTPSPALSVSSSAALQGSSSSSAAAPTTPSPALSFSLPAALDGSPSSSAAPPTTPSPSLSFSLPAALDGSSSTAPSSVARLSTMFAPPYVSSSTGTWATISSSISAATGEAASREIFAPLSTTSVPPSMAASGATPPLGSMACSVPTSSSVHAQTNAFATNQAGLASSFGPSVWSSGWYPNLGDLLAMPFMQPNEDLQDGDIQDDNTEQGELARRVVEWTLRTDEDN